MAQLAPPLPTVDSDRGWQLSFHTLDAEAEDGLELEVAGERYRHWLDGDGMVHALHLGDGRAQYRNSFVATAGKAKEDREGRRLYAGFGTRLGGGTALARLRNVRRRLARIPPTPTWCGWASAPGTVGGGPPIPPRPGDLRRRS